MAAPLIRIMFRTDPETRIVSAYFGFSDADRTLVSTMHEKILKDVPGAWEGWKDMLQKALIKCVESVQGVKVEKFFEMRPDKPHEQN